MFTNIKIKRQHRYLSKSTMAAKPDISLDTLNGFIGENTFSPINCVLCHNFDDMSLDHLKKGG